MISQSSSDSFSEHSCRLRNSSDPDASSRNATSFEVRSTVSPQASLHPLFPCGQERKVP